MMSNPTHPQTRQANFIGLMATILLLIAAMVGLGGCSTSPINNPPAGIEIRDTRGAWHTYLPDGLTLDVDSLPRIVTVPTYDPQHPTREAITFSVRTPSRQTGPVPLEAVVYRLPSGQTLPQSIAFLRQHITSASGNSIEQGVLSEETIKGRHAWTIRKMASIFESSMIVYFEKQHYILQFLLVDESEFNDLTGAMSAMVESFNEISR